jgi:hypothetical protein
VKEEEESSTLGFISPSKIREWAKRFQNGDGNNNGNEIINVFCRHIFDNTHNSTR